MSSQMSSGNRAELMGVLEAWEREHLAELDMGARLSRKRVRANDRNYVDGSKKRRLVSTPYRRFMVYNYPCSLWDGFAGDR